MNKVASYLQSHLSGEVLDSPVARNYFSTDASVLEVTPSLIVYPRSTNDIRKVARFSWQLAEKGHVMPITARGSGTDQSGAAIGKGIILVFPAHLNKILELDTQQKLVRVQPGVNFKSLQETLNTHGLFLPPFPASYAYSTIGGAIANNSAGELSLKYGPMTEWVDKLEVVLANGELIQTGRFNKKAVEKKKGLATLEGELYRVVDGLLNEYGEPLDAYYDNLLVSKDSVGYDLRDIKRRDGSIDLTSLFVGSQGTLGVITEAILKVAPHNPHTSLLVAAFPDLESAVEAVDVVRNLSPSALEMIDRNLIEFAEKEQHAVFPEELVDPDQKPAIILFVEFDDDRRVREKKVKRAGYALRKITDRSVVSEDTEEQEKLWAIRHLAATVVNYNHDGKVAVPVIEDAAVPHEKLTDLVHAIEKLFNDHHLSLAIWGHAGDANLHVHPLLDLSKLTDRQKMLKLMSEYYKMVVDMGGSIAGEHSDGRLRVPFMRLQVGDELIELFEKLKVGFDPHGVLNPGVKVGTDMKQLVDMLRKEYSIVHLADHLPRT
jgi:FAD/FMN-containing dehydrogenase